MPKFNEKSLVEDYLIEELQKAGWTFIPASQLERESLEEPLLIGVLNRAIKKLNINTGITDGEISKVINELKLRGSGQEDAKKILNYLKSGIPIKFEKDRVLRYVRLFDYENLSNNEYTVSRQAVHHRADEDIRNDIILYINGIPLVNIECKSPTSFSETWLEAYKQIKDYEKQIPELYK